MAVTEVLHQPPSLRSQALGALPDVIPQESYSWVTKHILARPPDKTNSDDAQSIMDRVCEKDNGTALSILMLNPDFDMDYLIEQLPEAAAQGKINIVRTILLKIPENPDLVRNPTDLLGAMLIKAAQDILETFARSDRSREIPSAFLNQAIMNAVRAGELRIARDIVLKQVGLKEVGILSFIFASSYAGAYLFNRYLMTQSENQ